MFASQQTVLEIRGHGGRGIMSSLHLANRQATQKYVIEEIFSGSLFFSFGETFMEEKDVLLVNGKLLVAMGLPWTLEWFYGTLFDQTSKKTGFGLFIGYLNIVTNAFLVKSCLKLSMTKIPIKY